MPTLPTKGSFLMNIFHHVFISELGVVFTVLFSLKIAKIIRSLNVLALMAFPKIRG